jgi:hypothetical protein
MSKSFVPPIAELARWAAYLARLSRLPKTIKITRTVGAKQEQECARRRRFYERHGTAIGGGSIHAQLP